jgi:hypothetical protein
MFLDQHSEHFRIKPVDDAVLLDSATPTAPHPQRDPFTLLASHLLPDRVQVIVHAAAPPFLFSDVHIFPNSPHNYPLLA